MSGVWRNVFLIIGIRYDSWDPSGVDGEHLNKNDDGDPSDNFYRLDVMKMEYVWIDSRVVFCVYIVINVIVVCVDMVAQWSSAWWNDDK